MKIIDAHVHLVQCIAGTGAGASCAAAAADRAFMRMDRSVH